jgi:hypothetical protein
MRGDHEICGSVLAGSWTSPRVFGRLCSVDHIFTVGEARGLLPEVQARAAEMIAIRADLVELAAALRNGERSSAGGLPEMKALEARMNELAEWFPARGIEIKGLAPVLLDFPARFGDQDVLLCWLEGEPELGWYHRLDHGFGGRRPIPADPA